MECRTIPRVLHNISLKFAQQSYNIFLFRLVLLHNKLHPKEHINMQELTLTTPSLLFSAVSLILLTASLCVCIWEINISVNALEIHLQDISSK